MKRFFIVAAALFISAVSSVNYAEYATESAAKRPIETNNINVNDAGRIVIKGVTEIPNASAEQIHNAIIKWIGVTYNSPKNVIKTDTPEVIILDGFGPTDESGKWKILLTFDIKDNKYRWSMTNMESHPAISIIQIDPLPIEGMPLYLEQSSDEFVNSCNSMFSSYIEDFTSKIKEFATDEW